MSEASTLNLNQAVDLSALMHKKTEEKAKQLPKPSGYRILCTIPEVNAKYEDSEVGLIKADETMRNEETLTTVLFVVELGADCYKDAAKFPTGPWCKQGDFILVRPYAGSRLIIHGREFRLINDDNVEAVVDDPRGIKRK
jgi:co-chaperonin GroES (HSP10)